MDLIVTLLVGGIIGWLASIVMKTNAQMGILANILVGVVGSVLGMWLGRVLGVAAGGGPAAWLMSLLGAMILIGLARALGLFRPRTLA